VPDWVPFGPLLVCLHANCGDLEKRSSLLPIKRDKTYFQEVDVACFTPPDCWGTGFCRVVHTSLIDQKPFQKARPLVWGKRCHDKQRIEQGRYDPHTAWT
jgi:hypothetical protein